MQTFLPLPSFRDSAACLDRQRLGKQRVEVLQLLNGLTGRSVGWTNHPASIMWQNHIYALSEYGMIVCWEWIARGYKDTCRNKIISIRKELTDTGMPSWLGDHKFHLSHRSNLIRKLPEYYQPMWPGIPSTLPYVWPKCLDVKTIHAVDTTSVQTSLQKGSN